MFGETQFAHPRAQPTSRSRVLWLQGITIIWMLVECAVSGLAAAHAHSAALFAFASDSVVELLSAGVVLLPVLGVAGVSERAAGKFAGYLLYVLAGVVAMLAALALWRGAVPDRSVAGMAITATALVVMPALAWSKRREARRTGNVALSADAAQSATCAYLAALTLLALLADATLHIRFLDAAAALLAIPLLLREGREALAGRPCGCH